MLVIKSIIWKEDRSYFVVIENLDDVDLPLALVEVLVDIRNIVDHLLVLVLAFEDRQQVYN